MHATSFTPETARIAAAKSHEVRRKKREAETLRLAEEHQRQQEAASTTLPGDSYLAKRLARVREALDRYDALLLVECDPQKAAWIVTVTSKLAEQERILCGRPAPGNYRPTAPRRRSTNGTQAEVIPE